MRGDPRRWLVAATLLSLGCGEDDAREAGSHRATTRPPSLRDVTGECGVDFVHYAGSTGGFFIPEIMGAGCALLDHDGDGDLDLYAVQGALLDRSKTPHDSLFPPREAIPRNRLYRNELAERGDGRIAFTDVTDASGVGDPGYGMGCAVGDYDNDGDPDLYVTNFGANQLFRNRGDGVFDDVTSAAGVDDPRWSASAAFLDVDRDGRLDLFVTAYVDFSVNTSRDCTRLAAERDYCGPLSYEPLADRLFHNEGDGRFTDVSRAAGIDRLRGNGLGVVCADLDDDGWVDIFVANDAMPNRLWTNRRDGSFEDTALAAGVATNRDGRNEAGMGVAAGDFDGDGDLDLFLTHESGETNTLYVNLGGGLFEDATSRLRLATSSRPFAGFGCGWIDHDLDGRPDLVVVNGAVRTMPALVGMPHPFHQGDQLFRNEAAGFVERTEGSGLDSGAPTTGRGLALGDLDNDGDVDIVTTSNSGPLRVLRNDTPTDVKRLRLKLVGTTSPRDASGSRVEAVLDDGTRLVRRLGTDGSYLSASDPRLCFAIGATRSVRSVTVRWTSGAVERWDAVGTEAIVTLREGDGTPPG